ncbi:hypothetical protein DWD10_15825 [Salmonella enterica]|nr:hypothetical protein [Salmonella enterica]
MQIAKSYKSGLPVIVAHINANNGRFPLEKLRLNQRYAVFTLIGCVFVWIKGDFHVFIVATKNDFANLLHWLAVLSYAYPAPYKTGAGIETPKLTKATPDAESVFFVVRYTRHSMAWCATMQRSYNRRSAVFLSHHAAHNGAMCSYSAGLAPSTDTLNRISRRPIMVTLAGQPQGWPVSFVPGSLNPVNVTAPIEIETSSGDSLTRTKEAAMLATTPTLSQSQLVILPYVSAVDPSDGEFQQMISSIEQRLLDRVKEALDEAGVEWIDPRTKERSKPAAADSVEGSDNA